MADRKNGYYAKLYRDGGGELHIHFFHPGVLDPYKEDPSYNFYGSHFHTKETSDQSIEPSGIQQFEWGHMADGSPCIAALRPHLITLSYNDQLHWRSKELPLKQSDGAKIDSRYTRPMLYGVWPDTMSRFAAVYVFLKEIQNIFVPEVLFPALPEHKPDFLAPLSYNSKKAFIKFAQDLYTILDIKPSVLSPRISSHEKERLVKKGERWNMLALYFEECELLSETVVAAIGVIKEVNQLRVKSAHKIHQAESDEDYNKLQGSLVFRLQESLKVLLLAFAVAEKDTKEVIPRRVLKLKIE